MGFNFLDLLEKYENQKVDDVRAIIENKNKKFDLIIKEAFKGEYVGKAEAIDKLKLEFVDKNKVPKGISVDYIKENMEELTSKIQKLDEGEIKIIVNNYETGSKGSASVSYSDDMELESVKPKKRGRKSKADMEAEAEALKETQEVAKKNSAIVEEIESAKEDEEEGGMEEAAKEPKEDDCFVTQDETGYVVECGGRYLGHYKTQDIALEKIEKWQEKNGKKDIWYKDEGDEEYRSIEPIEESDFEDTEENDEESPTETMKWEDFEKYVSKDEINEMGDDAEEDEEEITEEVPDEEYMGTEDDFKEDGEESEEDSNIVEYEFKMPAFLAPVLVNGDGDDDFTDEDYEALSDAENTAKELAAKHNSSNFHWSIGDESYFSNSPDFGSLAGDVVDAKLVIIKDKNVEEESVEESNEDESEEDYDLSYESFMNDDIEEDVDHSVTGDAEIQLRKAKKEKNAEKIIYYTELLSGDFSAAKSYDSFKGSWAYDMWKKKNKDKIEQMKATVNESDIDDENEEVEEGCGGKFKMRDLKEEDSVNNYRVTVKHDSGKINIIVPASSEASAKELVCKSEGCPESAITNIRKIK